MTDGLVLEFDGTLRSADAETHLSSKEMQLLLTLASRRGRLVTKDALFTELYSGTPHTPEMKVVDVFACKVRKKLRSIGADDVIQTVWGQGYIWNSDCAFTAMDSSFVSFEASAKMLDRLDRLAIARDETLQQLVTKIVADGLPGLEEETWR